MDYTACTNKECPASKICYRFMMVWDNYQSVGEYTPDESGQCESFLPIMDGDKLDNTKSGAQNVVNSHKIK
jgi:hypothetical protein